MNNVTVAPDHVIWQRDVCDSNDDTCVTESRAALVETCSTACVHAAKALWCAPAAELQSQSAIARAKHACGTRGAWAVGHGVANGPGRLQTGNMLCGVQDHLCCAASGPLCLSVG